MFFKVKTRIKFSLNFHCSSNTWINAGLGLESNFWSCTNVAWNWSTRKWDKSWMIYTQRIPISAYYSWRRINVVRGGWCIRRTKVIKMSQKVVIGKLEVLLESRIIGFFSWQARVIIHDQNEYYLFSSVVFFLWFQVCVDGSIEI